MSTQHETFVDAFCGVVDQGLAWAQSCLAAAKAEHKDTIPDDDVVKAKAILIKSVLADNGMSAKTQANRATVARKILRNHTALSVALPKVVADKSWPRPVGRGFDPQTFEKLVTLAHKMNGDAGKVPTGTALASRFIERMNEPKKGRTPAQKAAAAFKALQTSGTGSAKWVAVIEAAIKEAKKQGLAIEG